MKASYRATFWCSGGRVRLPRPSPSSHCVAGFVWLGLVTVRRPLDKGQRARTHVCEELGSGVAQGLVVVRFPHRLPAAVGPNRSLERNHRSHSSLGRLSHWHARGKFRLVFLICCLRALCGVGRSAVRIRVEGVVMGLSRQPGCFPARQPEHVGQPHTHASAQQFGKTRLRLCPS